MTGGKILLIVYQSSTDKEQRIQKKDWKEILQNVNSLWVEV